MPRKVFVARHGQDEDNANGILNGRRDMPLTPLGHQQADTLAEKLALESIQFIISSPQQRAHQTALKAGKKMCLAVSTDEGLMEREFGVMTGKPVADIAILCLEKDLFRTEKITYFLRPEGAETLADVLNRAKAVLLRLLLEYPSGNLLLVSHGDVCKMLRAAAYGWDWQTAIQAPYFDNTEYVVLEVE